MVIHRLFVASLALCCITGCAVVPYQEPTDINAAHLTFVNMAPNGQLAANAFVHAKDCRGEMTLSRKGDRFLWVDASKTEEIGVMPGQEFSFYFSYRNYPKECAIIPATFTPRANGKYKAIFRANTNTCHVEMMTIQDGMETPEPTFRLRHIKSRFSSDQSACH